VGVFQKVIDFFTGYDSGLPSKLPDRNDPCWCGSGRKYKKCHLHEDEKKSRKAAAGCGPV